MRIWGVLVMCVAACGSVEGAWIEVQGTGATTRFEVFIASEDACKRCELQPKDVTTMLEGSRYTRDPDPVLDVTANASHAGTFRFQSGERDKVHAIVVVGYDGADAITGAALIEHLKTDTPHRYLVTLTPVTGEPLGPTPPTTGPQRAQVWGSDEVRGACAGLERWHDGDLRSRTFIVPADDPDCDGVTGARECNAYAYLSSTSSAQGPIDCVASTTSSGITVCRLGSTSCVDGQDRGPCEPRGACVPAAWCALAAPCADGEELVCLLAKLRMNRVSARIECEIPFEIDPNTNSTRTCDDAPATTTISGLDELFPAGAPACTTAGVISPSSPTLAFTTQLDLNGGTLAVEVEQASACAIGVTWTGGYLQASPNEVVVGLEIVTAGAHSIVLPMWITPRADCAIPPSCHLELVQDPITACTKP